MKITSINILGKLPQGLVELYADISEHAKALDINYLVVGAMARDLVLVHGFDAEIEHGTRDVDFGISIASWDEQKNGVRSRIIVPPSHFARAIILDLTPYLFSRVWYSFYYLLVNNR